MTRYRVVAPLITVHSESAAPLVPGRGFRVVPAISLHRGNILPGDVPQEQIEHHLATGQIEPVSEDEDQP